MAIMTRLIRIRYLGGRTLEVEQGTSILEASLSHGVEHMHACGGSARCTTCRVEVIDGIEHCPVPNDKERDVTALNGIRAPVRLACQLRPVGDVTIRLLLHSSGEAPPLDAEGDARELAVAVLFADIRGFTAFAERSLPFDVVHVLNRHFDYMGTLVELAGGRVISFQGDGMMCVFGLAGEADDAASSAAVTAVRMLDAVRTQASYCTDHFQFPLAVGIGIDFGDAVVGNVGYYRDARLNVIGDVVNTAARVQDLTKEMDAAILMTHPVRVRVEGVVQIGRSFTAEIRGKRGRHRLYEVLREAGVGP